MQNSTIGMFCLKCECFFFCDCLTRSVGIAQHYGMVNQLLMIFELVNMSRCDTIYLLRQGILMCSVCEGCC